VPAAPKQEENMSKTTTLGQLEKVAQRAHDRAAALEAQIKNIKSPEYSLVKQEPAEDGYLATYYLTKDGKPVSEKLNIPKDFLVKSAKLKTVTTYQEAVKLYAKPGDKYIDFAINAKDDGTGSAYSDSHIYLMVSDLVDVYTGGNGIEVSTESIISAKLDAANSNGLSVTADGLQLAAVTTSAAGVMSAEDKAKLDETVLATDAEIENMLNNIFGTPEIKVPEDLLAGPSEPEPIH